ncbi:MAG: D-alanine--D-alanine ligase [Bacteroidales bacterium]|nr:D-alanine--D-alanine ligase [Bacteroidales bacterium]
MRKKIAVVYGGDSGEYGISVQSGQVVNKFLDPNEYKVYPILMQGTTWHYECDHLNVYPVDKNDFSIKMMGEIISFDCVFIAIHGTPGEDGKLQGYLEMMKIPYTTCDHVVSALTFNKNLCKHVVQNMGVKTARSMMMNKADHPEPQKILQNLNLPLFVKPNNGGSSVGMTKVNQAEHLQEAIERALKEDDEILVEEFIKGREITCGVLKSKNEVVALPITEIISKKEFFDFEAKYDPKLADEIVPAQIPETIFKNCQETSVDLYKKLNCRGVVRFDYIYNDDGMFFLEVNTVPGLTETSIVPKMAKSYGMSLTELFGILVEEALEKTN